MSKAPRTVPVMTSDEEAEAFLAQDLSNLDFTQFKPGQLEFAPKDARVNMRLPANLVVAVKARAGLEGIPYQRYIRRALEEDLARKAGAGRR